jgi:uncharacterized OB-fold protein
MSLLERSHQAPAAIHGTLPVTSRYSFGLAGERFFRAIKDEGVILGTHCPDCEITFVPGTAFCERCLNGLDEWVDVGTIGEVYTFTLLFEGYDGIPLEEPEILAFVKIGDGGLVHRLDEVEPDEIEIGLLVEAVFKPKEERTGSINDILYFRPLTSTGD